MLSPPALTISATATAASAAAAPSARRGPRRRQAGGRPAPLRLPWLPRPRRARRRRAFSRPRSRCSKSGFGFCSGLTIGPPSLGSVRFGRCLELGAQLASRPVQAHPGGNRAHAGRGRGLGDRQIVDRDQLHHRPLALGKTVHRRVEATRLGGGVDPRIHPRRVLLVEQGAAAKPLLPRPLATAPAAVVGDESAGDPVKPSLRRAASRPVTMGRVDRGEKDLRGQVGSPLTVPDPAGDEPLQVLDVLAVKRLEQVGIGTDPAQLLGADAAPAGGDHAQAAAERARRR